MEFRARFAPSPTGQVHIGNIRTAIFNWLCTRHAGGKFLLRIEDTDLERSTKQAIDTLLECMQWLGLDYDETPMYQTQQADKHRTAAKKLQTEGHAYKADPASDASPVYFRIPFRSSEYSFVRTVGAASMALAAGSSVEISRSGLHFMTLSPKGKEVENQSCIAGFLDLKVLDAAGNVLFALTDDNLQSILDAVTPVVVENAASLSFTRREVFYNDMVKGELAKPLDSMKDFIIVRSDGSPVFHLANVWDDVEQRVTHIVRGDDHVENTYRHLFLFQTLGFTPPVYAHLPMIVNAQGKPYSKRDGDAFVGDFRGKGFLPEALFNYLALLGWSPGDNREKMSRQELIEAFRIEKAQHTPAQFDMVKLTNMNGHYIAELPPEKFLAMAWDFSANREWRKSVDQAAFARVASLMQSRTKILTDINAWTYFFAAPAEFDPKGVKKFLKDETVRSSLLTFAGKLEAMPSVSMEQAEALEYEVEEAAGLKKYAISQPLRVAVTGLTIGAGMFETIALIGAAECAKRIRHALDVNPAA